MRTSLRVAAAGLAPLLLTRPPPAQAAKIAVIGTGNVGSALGPEFAALGHTIVYGSRTPTEKDVQDLVAKTGHGATATTQPEAVKGADIVLLAVPGNLAVQITQSLGDLSGKLIIDPTNRVNRSSADGYANHDVPGGSNAELIQAAAPGALTRHRLVPKKVLPRHGDAMCPRPIEASAELILNRMRKTARISAVDCAALAGKRNAG